MYRTGRKSIGTGRRGYGYRRRVPYGLRQGKEGDVSQEGRDGLKLRDGFVLLSPTEGTILFETY